MRNIIFIALLAVAFGSRAQGYTEFDLLSKARNHMAKGFSDSASTVLILLIDIQGYLTCDTIAKTFPGFAEKNHAMMQRCARSERYKRMPRQVELARIMDSIWKNDQLGRSMSGGIANDSSNYRVVDSILTIHGFMGPGELGYPGVDAQFLVLQHSGQEHMTKWYQKLKEAVMDGKLSLSHLALYEDRLMLYKGLPQLYGTQSIIDPKTGKYLLYPVDDMNKVNQRRMAFGMEPL